MATPKITLYVDVVSPFAYLGYYALRVGPFIGYYSCSSHKGFTISLDLDSLLQLFLSFLTVDVRVFFLLHRAKSPHSLAARLPIQNQVPQLTLPPELAHLPKM